MFGAQTTAKTSLRVNARSGTVPESFWRTYLRTCSTFRTCVQVNFGNVVARPHRVINAVIVTESHGHTATPAAATDGIIIRRHAALQLRYEPFLGGTFYYLDCLFSCYQTVLVAFRVSFCRGVQLETSSFRTVAVVPEISADAVIHRNDLGLIYQVDYLR